MDNKNRHDNSDILETLQEGVVILNSNGKVIFHNSAALEILETTADQLKQMDFNSDEHPAQTVLRTGKAVKNFILSVNKQKWIQINGVPRNHSGERQVILTYSDVTNTLQDSIDLKHFFRITDDLMCIANVDGYFKKLNPSFKKILGYDEQDLLSKPFTDYIHPDDLEPTANVVKTLSSGVPILHFENRYRTKSGDYKLITWVCQPDPATGNLFATGRDITALRASERKNLEILKAIDGIAIVERTDLRGRITTVNENFCKITGFSAEEHIGKDHRIISSNSHSKSFFENLWTTIQSGKSWTGDIKNKAKDGSFHFLRTVITPLKGVDGKPEQYIAIRFDVTDQMKNEGRLREAQSIAKIGSWELDLRSKHLFWSDEHYKIFGIENPQSQSQLYELYRHKLQPDDLVLFDRLIMRAEKFGENFTINHRIVLNEGSQTKFLQTIGKVVRDAHGKPISVAGTCQDVSEISRIQEENRFVLDALGIGVWKFNPITQELHWDKSMYKLYEMDPANFNGHYQAWEHSLTPESKSKAVEELNLALKGEKEFDTTFEISIPSGRVLNIGARGKVIRDSNGQAVMMYGMNWDRSKEVHMEQSLQQERAKSMHSAKLASLGEMAAGVAHEINNPLAVISGNVSLLSKFREDPEKFLAKTETIIRSTERIAKIVKGLRKFSRTSNGETKKPEPLAGIISEALTMTEAKANRWSAQIQVSNKTLKFIQCDALEIEQVLINLVNNSIDAVKNLKDKWIKINTFDEGDSVVLQVVDSGPCIDAQVEQKLFQPFFTTKVVGEGTGLGLSITKGILDQHQATIKLNRKFSTTCFEIRFPEAKLELKKVA